MNNHCRTIQFLLLTVLLLALLPACSSDTDAGEVASELADRLTDALDFDNGETIEGDIPEGSDSTDAPQISSIQASSLQLGAPFAITLQTDFGEPELVEETIMYAEKDGVKADGYIKVGASPITGLVDLSGILRNEMELAGQTFTLYFALKTADGVLGAYVAQTVTISDDVHSNYAVSESLELISAQGEESFDSGRPQGLSGQEVPQISLIDAPDKLMPGASFSLDLQTDFDGTVEFVIVSTPNYPGYKKIPVDLTTARKRGGSSAAGESVRSIPIECTLGSNLEVGDQVVFLWALQGEKGVGLYRNWVVTIGEGNAADGDALGDEDHVIPPADKDDLDGDADGDTIIDGDVDGDGTEGTPDGDDDPDMDVEEDMVTDGDVELEVAEEEHAVDGDLDLTEADVWEMESDGDLDAEVKADMEEELEAEIEPEEELEPEAEPEAEAEVEEESGTVYPEDYCRHAFCWNIPTAQYTCFGDSGELNPCPASGEDFYGQAGTYYTTGRSYSCYNTGSLLDPCPSAATEGEVVKDDVTGLMWQRVSSTAPQGCEAGNAALCTEDEAEAYCENLDYGGYSDWHLPGIAELLSLFDMGDGAPAVNRSYFADTSSANYWTSSYHAPANQYFYVQFADVYANREAATQENAVRCVRVDEEVTLPATRFSTEGSTETVVVDHLANLMWKTSTEGYKNWKSALSTCEALEWNGYNDWRLPTFMELLTIVNFDKDAPPYSDIPSMTAGYFTGTSKPDSAVWAMLAEVDTNGPIVYNRKTNTSIARCVRTAQ